MQQTERGTILGSIYNYVARNRYSEERGYVRAERTSSPLGVVSPRPRTPYDTKNFEKTPHPTLQVEAWRVGEDLGRLSVPLREKHPDFETRELTD